MNLLVMDVCEMSWLLVLSMIDSWFLIMWLIGWFVMLCSLGMVCRFDVMYILSVM